MLSVLDVGSWRPVSRGRLIAFSVGMALFTVVLVVCESGWVPILDGANLLFHEAGHMFFGILGPGMGLYGGTLGQLAFPVVLAVVFWHRRNVISCAVGCVWFFENFFNVARYMADARAQELPLVGGGSHDWTTILWRLGVLHRDVQIAAATAALGWTGMAVVWGWVIWRSLVKGNVSCQDQLQSGRCDNE